MKTPFVTRFLAPLILLSAAATGWATTYSAFNYDQADGGSTFLTGIRSEGGSDVLMTGVYTPVGTSDTQGLLYTGGLNNSGTWTAVNASIGGETVTSTALYGPNIIGTGTIRAVGSYKNSTSLHDHGLIYVGSATGGGTFQKLDVTIGSTVATNTIAHSTNGNLVVGNFDTGGAGRAFIYNITSGISSELTDAGAQSITAYGVWDNGNGVYTIAGGYSASNDQGLDKGYLADFNITTGVVSNFTSFNYDNSVVGDIVSHFDGITSDGHGGYNLTGDWIGATEGNTGGLGFFAHIAGNGDGTFASTAEWTNITYPSNGVTSGNSVVDNTVIGIYTDTTSPDVQFGYVAVVPEPNAVGLLMIGAVVVGFVAVARARKLA